MIYLLLKSVVCGFVLGTLYALWYTFKFKVFQNAYASKKQIILNFTLFSILGHLCLISALVFVFLKLRVNIFLTVVSLFACFWGLVFVAAKLIKLDKR